MAEKSEVANKTQKSPVKKKGMSFALSAFVVGLGAIIVKASGLIRDIVVSSRFSDNFFRDGYRLAFNIPDLFITFLSEERFIRQLHRI